MMSISLNPIGMYLCMHVCVHCILRVDAGFENTGMTLNREHHRCPQTSGGGRGG